MLPSIGGRAFIQAQFILLVAASSPSPWCFNTSTPAQPGMYGPITIDLDGPRGPIGQYVDLPSDPAAVQLFQQGLGQLWGFNNREARRSFEASAHAAPDCVLCFWGVAMSLSPSINYVIESQADLNAAAILAHQLMQQQPGLSNKTRRLVEAAQELVQDPSTPDSAGSAARAAYASKVCAPMEGPTDPDLDAICAGALMMQSPWRYYQSKQQGTRAALLPLMEGARDRLLRATNSSEGAVQHVLGAHLLIHLFEPLNAPSDYRWTALAATNGLLSLKLHQGHLTHMPAHLYLRVGKYAEGVATSNFTVQTNHKYLSNCLIPYGYGHNLKMLVAHARLCGMQSAALSAGSEAATTAAGEEESPGGGVHCVDCAGIGSPERILTLVRFGNWQGVLESPLPQFGNLASKHYNKAAYHYARAVALYVQGAVVQADLEAALAINASKYDGQRDATGSHLLVPHELRAIRAWRTEKNQTAAIAALRLAAAAVDGLPYLEPPRWYYPPRQCLGYALLDHNASESMAVFERDLDDFPENSWSLYGAAMAADVMGLSRVSAQYKARAMLGWKGADVPLVSPCLQLSS